jgi:hypothetical protein
LAQAAGTLTVEVYGVSGGLPYPFANAWSRITVVEQCAVSGLLNGRSALIGSW